MPSPHERLPQGPRLTPHEMPHEMPHWARGRQALRRRVIRRRLRLARTIVVLGLATGLGVLAIAGGPSRPGQAGRTKGPAASAGALRVLSVAWERGGHAGDGIVVRFTGAVGLRATRPLLAPRPPGHWVRDGDDAIRYEVPDGYIQASPLRVSVPGRSRPRHGLPAMLAESVTLPGPAPDVLRAQEILADLGYLPVGFLSAVPVPRTEQAERASFSDPPSGTFSGRWSGLPTSLRALWHPGTYGVVTEGAVMSFEQASSMNLHTSLTPALLRALAEVREGAVRPGPAARPYSYVLVREGDPETLTLYVNGRVVLASLANTGVDDSTPLGTWPIYLRMSSQTL
ncbi:MAG: hypothetical protein ACYCXN_14125, partial [Acidimicrobiales bacterium]